MSEPDARDETLRLRDNLFVSWTRLFSFAFLLVFFVAALDRFLEWDEAVFFTQSGGIDNFPYMPAWFGASREMGPPMLIRALRFTGLDLTSTRLGWAAISLLLSLFTFRHLTEHVGRKVAMASFFVLWTFWLTLAYSASFYGSLYAGIFSLLAISAYLSMRIQPGWRQAVLFGLAISGALAMRQLESAFVVVLLVLHSLVVNPTVIWKDRFKEGMTAFATFLAFFAAPWVYLTNRQYGSVSERFALLKTQTDALPSGWTWGVDEYVSILGGATQANSPFLRLPGWPLLAMAALGSTLVILAFLGARSPSEPTTSRQRPLLLIGLVVGFLTAFFTLRYASVEVQDRYVTMLAPLAAVLVGALWQRATAYLKQAPKSASRGVASVIVIVWLASQLALAVPYEDNRDSGGESIARVGSTMRVISGFQACTALSRYGAPVVQAASACRTTRVTNQETAANWASDKVENGEIGFILWPGTEDQLTLPDEWLGLEIPVGRTNQTLYYFKP